MVRRIFGNQYDGQVLRRNEGIEIRQWRFHDDDDAIHRKLLHAVDDARQGRLGYRIQGMNCGCVTIFGCGIHNTGENAGVAIRGHMRKHHADVIEPSVLQRARRVVWTIAKPLHRLLHLAPSLRTHGIAPIRYT